MLTGLCLVYTAFVTPFEVGVGLETELNALFFINEFINLIFIIDIIIQFFLPVPDPQRQDGSLERRRWKLAQRYLRSWFLLDVATKDDVGSGTLKTRRSLRWTDGSTSVSNPTDYITHLYDADPANDGSIETVPRFLWHRLVPHSR